MMAQPSQTDAEQRYGFDPKGPMPTPDQFLGPYYPVQKISDGGQQVVISYIVSWIHQGHH